MKNKWKISFIVLLGANMLIIISLIILMTIPANDKAKPQPKLQRGEYVSFGIQSNKEDLNKLINYYLKNEAKGSPVNYEVNLGNEVELNGTLPFFSEELNMKLTFEPEAQKNGDLILRQKSISIGSLHLPVAYVLKFISDNYKLPPGVDIRPSSNLIYINMQNLKLKSNVKVKVNKFVLKKNDISFTLLVPVK